MTKNSPIMKHLRNLCLGVILLKCVSLSAYNAGSVEVFFHDTHVVLPHLNSVSQYFQDIIGFTMAAPAGPLVPLDSYRFFVRMPAAPGLVPIAGFVVPPPLGVPQKATLAINRFLIGITNGHHNLNNFAFPDQIVNAAFAGFISPYVIRALNCGGYDDTTARFLHHLITGVGFPAALRGLIGGLIPDTVVILLSLDKRVSKNMKEIHWNSSSLLVISPPIAGAMVAAFPAIGPALALGYDSIKTLLNNHFPVWAAPNSATAVTFRQTSDN